MMYLTPFEADHYRQMRVQDAQSHMATVVSLEDLKGLENMLSVTLMDDGKPLVCAGVLPYWVNRGLVWSFLSSRVNAGNFWAVHSHAKKWIAGLPFRRLEASVDVSFLNGHRWIKALGFKVETPLQEKFQPGGRDSVGYVRIR